ncbi:MAG: Mut7-C ubiquitin/RNAse domain-containing protein [Gammaproteobacteria bacterium]|nr:Mut7-C ubiquitin/RNAse domain-containing protein [Gammaproteobacteria bacterium]NNF61357.1 Mut7-C ubiquitin/RNAse domain-containing protein [Gammaproteobacteria bacterium]
MTDPHAPKTRRAEFRFYEELNDFLPADKQRLSFVHEFSGTPAVKDAIEALGVPHTEVDLILVGDIPVEFSHRLEGGERVAVFPVFERLDISPATRLRPRPLRQLRFVLDVHLGKLARLLRLAGFDSVYRNDLDDLEIIEIAGRDKRTILTRDKGILKHARVTHGYWVRDTDPPEQLREIVDTFDLRRSLRPFSRCMECNGALRVADDGDIIDRVPFSVLVAFDEFWQCESCQQVYWKGSHYRQLELLLDQI